MDKSRQTTLSSAELPVAVLQRLGDPSISRPRVEVVFDDHSRMILGFRVTDGRPVR